MSKSIENQQDDIYNKKRIANFCIGILFFVTVFGLIQAYIQKKNTLWTNKNSYKMVIKNQEHYFWSEFKVPKYVFKVRFIEKN